MRTGLPTPGVLARDRHETTVSELLNVDLSYAPPFSPVWDPVLIAARKAWQRVEGDRRSPEPTDDTKP